MALKAACDYANKERVLACVQQIHHEFSELNIRNPRIAVAALNPHGLITVCLVMKRPIT